VENFTPRPSRPGLNTDTKKEVVTTVVPTTRAFSAETPSKNKKPAGNRLWLWIAAAVIAMALVGGVAWFLLRSSASSNAIDTTKYQAVFLTNGQVYFGKLELLNDNYLKLTNVFYIQSNTSTSSENPQKTTTDSTNMQLIKLGSEVHGPEDEMIVARDQVLFYENLKSDGKVAKLIDQYKP
jgi:hypothetical protein